MRCRQTGGVVGEEIEPRADVVELVQQAHRLEQFAHEGRAAFEGQRHHRDAPAVVLLADPVRHRDPHLVEEELRELGRALDRAQRLDLNARRVHRHDEPGDATVALVAGAHEQLAEVGDLGVRGPDLRAGDDVVVAVAYGPRAERGQVASCVRLAEALAPDLLAAEDGRQVALALGRGAFGDDGRSCVQQADEVDADVGRAGPLTFFLEDQLLHR